MSLYDPIRLHARLDPNRLALLSMATYLEALSYGHLDRLVGAFVRHFQAGGITPDSAVTLDISDGMAALIAMLALSECPVRSVATTRDAGSPGGIVVRDGASAQPDPGENTVLVDIAAMIASDEMQTPPAPRPGGRTEFVFSSRDAAGQPPVVLGERQLAARIEARALICDACGGGAWMSAAPPVTETGFSTIVGQLRAGRRTGISGGNILEDIQALGLYLVPGLLVPSADFRAYFQDRPALGAAMAGVERILVAGAAPDARPAEIVALDVAQDFFVALESPVTGPVAAGRFGEIRGESGRYGILPGVEVRDAGGALEFRSGGCAPQPGSEDGWVSSAWRGSADAQGLRLA